MKTVDYSIEGLNLKVEIDTNLDSEQRMTAYYIEAIRNETGMTRPQFSEWLGMPLRTLQAWEKGTREMPEYVLRLIAYKVRMEKEAGRI